jgi:collagenase-like PrtC family protease
MEILSPLDYTDDIEKLVQAGAEEFFCGLLDEEWYKKYPVISTNRRPAGKGHFRNFEELKSSVDVAHNVGTKVYFTLNEHYYINAQFEMLKSHIDNAVLSGVDALILSDYGLMAWLRENGYDVPIHISTGGTVFNWRTAKFYCDEFGAESITFPRHLVVEELKNLIEKLPDVDTSVFVLNSRCINVDGFCTFQHGLAGKTVFPMFRNACMLPYSVEIFSENSEAAIISPEKKENILSRQKVWEKVHVDDHPCGACAMYEFNEMGIKSLKIVGRGNSMERKLKDIIFLKRLVTVLDSGVSRDDFRNKSQSLYKETYNRPCREHMCYFPSVMKG